MCLLVKWGHEDSSIPNPINQNLLTFSLKQKSPDKQKAVADHELTICYSSLYIQLSKRPMVFSLRSDH